MNGYTLNLELSVQQQENQRERKKLPVNIISIVLLQSDINKTLLILHDK